MNRRSMRLLLLMLTIALAVAPLRGVLASPDLPASGGQSHCDMMQAGMPAATDPAEAPASPAGKHCPDCVQDCPGDRCAGTCAIFLHAFVALADGMAAGTVMPVLTTIAAPAAIFPDGAIPPLYRPPIPAS